MLKSLARFQHKTRSDIVENTDGNVKIALGIAEWPLVTHREHVAFALAVAAWHGNTLTRVEHRPSMASVQLLPAKSKRPRSACVHANMQPEAMPTSASHIHDDRVSLGFVKASRVIEEDRAVGGDRSRTYNEKCAILCIPTIDDQKRNIGASLEKDLGTIRPHLRISLLLQYYERRLLLTWRSPKSLSASTNSSRSRFSLNTSTARP